MEGIKGYKVFNADWTCRDFQYEVGKTYEMSGPINLCERGFHFCKKLIDCFIYYSFNSENKVAEIIALGHTIIGENKSCTDKIKIVREIPWEEVLNIANFGESCEGYGNVGNCNIGNGNTGNQNVGRSNSGNFNIGNRNTGYHNKGNCNTGYKNTGHSNTGDDNIGLRNSGRYNYGNYNSNIGNIGNYNTGMGNIGDYNSGDWNNCNFSTGCFNTVNQKIYLFNKISDWTYEDWLNSEAYRILREYIHYRNIKVYGKEEKDKTFFANSWWKDLDEGERLAIKSIPNFDKEIFKEITGVNVNCTKEEEESNEN